MKIRATHFLKILSSTFVSSLHLEMWYLPVIKNEKIKQKTLESFFIKKKAGDGSDVAPAAEGGGKS